MLLLTTTATRAATFARAAGQLIAQHEERLPFEDRTDVLVIACGAQQTARDGWRAVLSDVDDLEAVTLPVTSVSLVYLLMREVLQSCSPPTGSCWRRWPGCSPAPALLEFFPAAVAAFADLTAPDALQLLDKAPDPASAARLSISQISAALRQARRRDVPTKAAAIQAALRTQHLGQPQHEVSHLLVQSTDAATGMRVDTP